MDSYTAKDKHLIRPRRETAVWPIVLAILCPVLWMVPLFGIPASIATIIGGIQTERKVVTVIGIIFLVVSSVHMGTLIF